MMNDKTHYSMVQNVLGGTNHDIYIYPISRKKGNHKNDIPTLVKHSTKGSLKWALDSSGKHHPELTLLIWIYPRNQMQCGPLVNSDR